MGYKTYRYRLNLNEANKQDFANHFGCTRMVYNHFLYQHNNSEVKNYLKIGTLQKELTLLKKNEKYKWLNNVSNMCLQGGLIDLIDAFKRMSIGNGYPNYKTKYDIQSCRFNQFVTNKHTSNPGQTIKIDFKKHKVCLPVVGWLNFYRSKRFNGEIVFATVIKETDDNYYIAITVKEEIKKLVPTTKEIGIDMGLKSYIVGSDGLDIPAPKFFRKSKNKLKRAQRKLNKRKLNSNRYNKQKLVVAKLHKKISNQRNDFLHKLSTKLINENQVISVETLAVKNMVKNHKLALSISDAAWGEFIRQLTYKAEWYGRTLLKIGTFEPSSKMHNKCGYINKELTLKDRIWHCPTCDENVDRDFNASLNILCLGKCPDKEENKTLKKV